VVLRVTNDIWASALEQERPIQEYADALALDYRSKVSLVDFRDEEVARATINGEVSRQTEGTIEELLAPGLIVPGVTTMILTNTIYFKASWAQPFVEASTQPAPFRDLEGSSSDVEMMDAVSVFDYTETDAVQAIRLPYVGGETALLVLLPKTDFAAFESGFDSSQLSELRSELSPVGVHLRLPTFSMRSTLKLKETLQRLGMDAGFDDSPSYDFSGIGPAIEFITEVVHEAFIAVDEVGTEAGAATAIIFGRESAGPLADVDFTADRPFMVVLEDVPTGAVLFAGRYVKPE
jgi:serpin B